MDEVDDQMLLYAWIKLHADVSTIPEAAHGDLSCELKFCPFLHEQPLAKPSGITQFVCIVHPDVTPIWNGLCGQGLYDSMILALSL